MFKEKVQGLLDAAMAEEESLFLIDFSIGADNAVKVVLDGDSGVSLQDCMRISRALEHNLDRDETDFSLEVTSAGAAAPMALPRQYFKNIGRKLKVTTEEGVYEGNLVEALEKGIALEWKAREPKPVGKGKITVQKRKEIDFSDIKEAKVILKF
ncbi:MAG: ribosome assembly cofactor RimP [Bacteroidota bacterium]